MQSVQKARNWVIQIYSAGFGPSVKLPQLASIVRNPERDAYIMSSYDDPDQTSRKLLNEIARGVCKSIFGYIFSLGCIHQHKLWNYVATINAYHKSQNLVNVALSENLSVMRRQMNLKSVKILQILQIWVSHTFLINITVFEHEFLQEYSIHQTSFILVVSIC